MRKTTAAVVLSLSTLSGAVSTEVIFDYMEHDTAQDLRECADSIGENGCTVDYLSGYVETVVNQDNGVYSESISPEAVAIAADSIDESTEGVRHQTLILGGMIGLMLGGSVVMYDSTEGKDRRDRKVINQTYATK